LTAERRPRVFNSTVLRKIFGPKEYEVTGEWIRLHIVDLYDPHSHFTRYYSGRQIKNAISRACGTYGRQKRYIHGLAGRPGGKRPLARPRRGRNDNIKMDVHEMGWGVTEWIDLAQDRDRWLAFVNAVMSLQVL
jgi:hypothetical protein